VVGSYFERLLSDSKALAAEVPYIALSQQTHNKGQTFCLSTGWPVFLPTGKFFKSDMWRATCHEKLVILTWSRDGSCFLSAPSREASYQSSGRGNEQELSYRNSETWRVEKTSTLLNLWSPHLMTKHSKAQRLGSASRKLTVCTIRLEKQYKHQA
jgi:hypothetical protein